MSQNVTEKSNSSVMTLNRTSCVDLEQVAHCCELGQGSESSLVQSKWLSFLIAGAMVSLHVLVAFILAETLSRECGSSTYALTYDNITLLSSLPSPYLPLRTDLTRYGVEPNPGPPKKGGRMAVVVVKAPKKKPNPQKKGIVVMRGIKGHGGYGEDIGKKIGGWIGDKAQSFIQSITGFGDYTVRSNTLVNGGSPPSFQMGNHCTKICHREFVGLVSSPGSNFTITPYPINPKSPFFPWLSEIALSFEQYKIRGMVVEFKTTSATAVSSTNTALGSVIIATQYNVLAAPFATQQQMEAYQFVTSCAPSTSMIHPIECDPGQNSVSELYVDSSNGDPRLEYLGTTYVATVGQQAASVIGELWISYEIDLIRPKLFSGAPNLGLTAYWSFTMVAPFINFQTLAMDFFAGYRPNQQTWPIPVPDNNLYPQMGSDFPLSFPAGLANEFVVPGWVSGLYQFTYEVDLQAPNGALMGTTSGAVVVSGGAKLISSFYSPVFGQNAAPSSATGQYSGPMIATIVLKFAGNNPGVPVVVNWFPWVGAGDGVNVAGAKLMVTGVGLSGL